MTVWAQNRSARIFGKAIRPIVRFSGNGQKSPNKFGKTYSSLRMTEQIKIL